MQKTQKTPLSTKQKIIVFSSVFLIGITVLSLILWASKKEPTWSYAQSFGNNRLLVCVDKTYKQHKSSKEDFFLIHIYDFQTNDYREAIKVAIADGQDFNSEVLGFSEKYIWLKASDFTAVEIRTGSILDFAALKKRICSKNPALFKDVIEMAKVGDYLKATNQEGDEFFLNVETFEVSKDGPKPLYGAFHKQFTVLTELPRLTNDPWYHYQDKSKITLGNTDYVLKPVYEGNRLKRSFFSSMNDGEEEITVSVTDSTQMAIWNGEKVSTLPQEKQPATTEKRLTDQTFINAVGIGIAKNCFVFRYQKKVDPMSAWYMAWFDLKTNSVVREINLETKALKLEENTEFLNHWVSLDGKWVFFAIRERAPVRMKL